MTIEEIRKKYGLGTKKKEEEKGGETEGGKASAAKMSIEEIRKKYGLSAKDEESDEETTGGSSSGGKMSIEEIRKKYGLGGSGIDRSYLDAFASDTEKFSKTDMADAYRVFGELDLGTRAGKIRKWLDSNEASYTDKDAYKQFSDAIDRYIELSGEYASFADEAAYGKWYEAYKADEEYNANFENIDANKASQGWQKYLADEETAKNAPKNDVNNDGKEAWWEKALGYLSDVGYTADTSLPTAGVTQTIHDLRNDEYYNKRPEKDWTEEQKNAFGQLYAVSPKLAYDFAEETNNRNAKKKEEDAVNKIQASATSNFGAGFGHTIGAIATAPLGMADFLNDLAMANAGRDIVPDGNVSPFEYSQAVTGGITEHLNTEIGTLDEDIPIIGGKGLGDLYALGTSIAQSMASAYTFGPGGTLVAYFGQGAASGMDEALARGASDWQAALYGTALGAFEGIAESIGIDNLFKLGSATTIKGFLKNILKQAGAEGMEEGLTALLSNIADNAIMQDKSDFNIRVSRYLAQGMSESEAKKRAWLDSVEGIAFDTIAGASSGGVSGGFHTTIQNIAENQQIAGHGQAIIDKGGVDPLRELAYKVAEDNQNREKKRIERLTGRVASKATAKNVGRLSSALEGSIIKQNRAELQSALIEKGLSEKEAKRVAEYLGGTEEFTSKQKAEIEGDARIKAVVSELLDNPDSAISERGRNLLAARLGVDAATATGSPSVEGETLSVTENFAEKEISAESEIEASADGKTIVKETGKEVSVEEIASIEDGKIEVIVDGGDIVDAKDLSFASEDEAILYGMVANMGVDAQTANALIKGFDASDGVSAIDYAIDIPLAYQYGKIGYLKGLERLNNLTPEQRNTAYVLGRDDVKASGRTWSDTSRKTPETDKAKAADDGIFYEGFELNEDSLTEVQKASLAGVRTLAKMSPSVEFHMYESIVENGKKYAIVNGKKIHTPNGFFRNGNEIYIDINAGNGARGAFLYTASHEVVHFIAENSFEDFKALADFLFEHYGENNVPVDSLIKREIDKLKKGYESEGKALPNEKVLYMKAYEEVVANAMSKMFADPTSYEKLAKLKSENLTLWEKIGEAIKRMLDKLESMLGIYEGRTPDQIAAHYVDDFTAEVYDKLQDLYLKGFVNAGANYQASIETRNLEDFADAKNTEGDTLYSVDDDFDRDYSYENLSASDFYTNGIIYSYDFLTAQKDMVAVELPKTGALADRKGVIDDSKVLSEGTKNALSEGVERDGKLYVKNVYTGRELRIDNSTIKHGLDGTYNRHLTNARIGSVIGSVVKNAIPINGLKNTAEKAIGTYAMVSYCHDSQKRQFIAVVTVEQHTGNVDSFELYDVAHAVSGRQKKGSQVDTKSPGVYPIEATAISIAQLLEIVNSTHQSILSDDVLAHIGETRNPKGSYSDKVLFSDQNTGSFSNRSLLAGALESAAKEGEERNRLRNYKTNLRLIEAEQAKLSEVRSKANEIRFTKGRTAEETKKMRELDLETKQIATRINSYDRELLKLEAMQPIKDILNREKQKAYKKAEKEGREALAKYREKAAKTQQELITHYQDSRKKAVEGRRKTEMRHKIQKVARELDGLLNRGTKEKNVKKGESELVRRALDLSDMLFATDDELLFAGIETEVTDAEKYAMERYKALYDEYHSYDDSVKANKEKRSELRSQMNEVKKGFAGVLERERIRIGKANATGIYDALIKEYEALENSEFSYIRNAFSSEALEHIKKLKGDVGETLVKDMTLSQLEDVYKAFRMIRTMISNSNKMFGEDIKASVETLGRSALQEVLKHGHKQGFTAAGKMISGMAWNNLKPVYLMERVGSKTLQQLFGKVLEAESEWARYTAEAAKYIEEQKKKFGYKKWDLKQKHTFKTETGLEYQLNLEQMLSIYAYVRRGDQALDHLQKDGFVFDKMVVKKKGIKIELNDKTAYRVSDAVLYQITGNPLTGERGILTDDQRAFVEAMQKYLSEDLAARGNKVSNALYGIDLFSEENYFTLRSEGAYLERVREQEKGGTKIKNRGFSKPLQQKASNAIVLSEFTDLWSSHVIEMNEYAAFTLPLEDLYRVYNYSVDTEGGTGPNAMGVIPAISNAYGDMAVKAIDRLLDDINGGAKTDFLEGPAKVLVGSFKKAKVMMSLSVIVQQPSAIVRAMAYIGPQYFVGEKTVKTEKKLWEELKRYAPVAIIKEMGYFDTGLGLTAKEWVKGEKTFWDHLDDGISWAPAKADEMTWCAIWKAVKRETLRKNPKLSPVSEEFLTIAGKRFEEVIRLTQVYDSTLSRSANMRDKNLFMQMATSFMAEPTTSINMLEMSVRSKDKKRIAATIGAVYGSFLLNAILVALPYAARDDDEDETFAEKYLSALTESFINNGVLVTSIPFVKDIWSIAQGYDVERMDMSLVSDLMDSFVSLISECIKEDRDPSAISGIVVGMVGDLANLTGIPLKNFVRDVKGIINFGKTVYKDIGVDERDTTWNSLFDALEQSFKDSIPVWGRFPDESKRDKLYDALIKGDTEYVSRLKNSYSSEEAYESAIRASIKEKYGEGEISRSAATRMLTKHGGYDEDKAYWKLKEWDFYKSHGKDAEWSRYDSFYKAVKTGKNLKAVIKEYTDHGVSKETLASQITSYYKPLYKKMSNRERAGIKGYLLNAYALLGYDRAKKSKDIDRWLED